MMPRFAARFPDVPAWFQAEAAGMLARGGLVLLRLRPERMTGVSSAAPE